MMSNLHFFIKIYEKDELDNYHWLRSVEFEYDSLADLQQLLALPDIITRRDTDGLPLSEKQLHDLMKQRPGLFDAIDLERYEYQLLVQKDIYFDIEIYEPSDQEQYQPMKQIELDFESVDEARAALGFANDSDERAIQLQPLTVAQLTDVIPIHLIITDKYHYYLRLYRRLKRIMNPQRR